MVYVGIDPDVHKSGLAVWKPNEKELDTYAVSFWELIDKLKYYHNAYDDELVVILEAGWLNKKSNYHYAQNRNVSERIAKNVGANHQVGKLIEEYLRRNGIAYRLYKPKNKKWSKQEVENVFGLKIKNQDVIDAVILVIGLS